jgi:hypothetical protein
MSEARALAKCNSCGALVDVGRDSGTTRAPCDECGATGRIFFQENEGKVGILSALSFKMKRPGIFRGPAIRGFVGDSIERRTGKAMRRRMLVDRINDLYQETVVDPSTGVTIHETTEKLTEHQGHGDARVKPPTEV